MNQRVDIEITGWNWPLHVGARPSGSPPADPGEPGFICASSLWVRGTVIRPDSRRGETAEVILMDLPRRVIEGEDRNARRVGWYHAGASSGSNANTTFNLFLPQDLLTNATYCLGAKWRSLCVWIGGDGVEGEVTDYAFSDDPLSPD